MGFFNKTKGTKNVNQYKKIISTESEELEEIKRDMDEYNKEAVRLRDLENKFYDIEDIRKKIEKIEIEVITWTKALEHLKSLGITKEKVLRSYENKILDSNKRKEKLLKRLIELTEWEDEMMVKLSKHSSGIIKGLNNVKKMNDDEVHQLDKDIKKAYVYRKHFQA